MKQIFLSTGKWIVADEKGHIPAAERGELTPAELYEASLHLRVMIAAGLHKLAFPAAQVAS